MTQQLPKLDSGTYRHSKTRQLYEVIGVAFQTEGGLPLVIYKPLYACDVELFARPYDMFVENVEIDGRVVPRFEKL